MVTQELSAANRLGCGALDYREQAQQVELKTGGMTASPHVLPDHTHLDTYEQVAASTSQLRGGFPHLFFLLNYITINSSLFS